MFKSNVIFVLFLFHFLFLILLIFNIKRLKSKKLETKFFLLSWKLFIYLFIYFCDNQDKKRREENVSQLFIFDLNDGMIFYLFEVLFISLRFQNGLSMFTFSNNYDELFNRELIIQRLFIFMLNFIREFICFLNEILFPS
jgi:hypothetical protein